MSKTAIILIHAEQAPGDSGDPLACVAQEQNTKVWYAEPLAWEGDRCHFSDAGHAVQFAMGEARKRGFLR